MLILQARHQQEQFPQGCVAHHQRKRAAYNQAAVEAASAGYQRSKQILTRGTGHIKPGRVFREPLHPLRTKTAIAFCMEGMKVQVTVQPAGAPLIHQEIEVFRNPGQAQLPQVTGQGSMPSGPA